MSNVLLESVFLCVNEYGYRNEHNDIRVRVKPKSKNMFLNLTLIRSKRSFHGNYSAEVDGRPKFVGDGNDNNTFQFPLWNAQNLSNTQHAVTITNIPTKQGGTLDIDFISIGREIGPPGLVIQVSIFRND